MRAIRSFAIALTLFLVAAPALAAGNPDEALRSPDLDEPSE